MNNPHMASNRTKGIGAVEASAVQHLSFCGANSYRGTGQLVENIEQDNGVDTDPQSGGPWYFGGSQAVTVNDPVFTGRAGQQGAHLLFGGNDFLTYSGQTGAVPPVVDGFAANFHKTTGGQAATAIFALRWQQSGAIQTLLTTKASGAFQGIAIYTGADDKLYFSQRGATDVVPVSSTATLVDDTDYILGVGFDGTDCTFWIGSGTGENVAAVFNTGTGSPTSPMIIGAIFDSTITTAGLYLASGTLLYEVILCNEQLDDTAFGNIITSMESYTGIDLTP